MMIVLIGSGISFGTTTPLAESSLMVGPYSGLPSFSGKQRKIGLRQDTTIHFAAYPDLTCSRTRALLLYHHLHLLPWLALYSGHSMIQIIISIFLLSTLWFFVILSFRQSEKPCGRLCRKPAQPRKFFFAHVYVRNRAHHQTHVPTKRPRDHHFLLNLS